MTTDGPFYDSDGVAVCDEDREFSYHVSVLGSHDAKWNTVNLVRRILAENVPGDLVECGVHSGGQPAMMAYALRRCGDTTRKVHLFDSWECHPQASIYDCEPYQKQLGVNPDPTRGIPSGVFPSSLEHCQNNLEAWGADLKRCMFYKGWLQEVLPPIAATFPPIALLRVDVDLHDSTVPVFEHLYDKVSVGGYIVSDDWGAGEGYDACRQATLDFFARRGLARPTVTRLPVTRGTVWWKKECA